MTLMLPSSLRLSSLEKEGPLHVSKWIKHQVLLDETEMEQLLAELDVFYLCPASTPVNESEQFISKEQFLEKYRKYVSCLKKGEPIDDKDLRRFFSAYLTASTDPLYSAPVGKDRYLIKASRPVIQVQLHHFYASTLDGKFHSMVLSEDSISWGLQFSYPQIFEDPSTHTFSKIAISDEFPNTELFKKIASWLRYNTVPTPFIFQGRKMRASFRLGKNSFSWISKHPGLESKGILVDIS